MFAALFLLLWFFVFPVTIAFLGAAGVVAAHAAFHMGREGLAKKEMNELGDKIGKKVNEVFHNAEKRIDEKLNKKY